MKIFTKTKLVTLMSVSLALGFGGVAVATAATTPSFGATVTYGILSSTYTNTASGVIVNGDIGFTTPPAVTPLGVHTNYGSGAPYSIAGIDQGNILNALASQPCTFTFPDTTIDLATDTSHGAIGVYTPGVYCTQATRTASIGTAGITLSGSGTYIFRINGALTTVANSRVTLAGASACDVFWTPTEATTLGSDSVFVGTDIDAAGITLGANVNWTGRALSFGGTVTTAPGDVISFLTCSVPVITPVTPVTPVATTTTITPVTVVATTTVTVTPVVVVVAATTTPIVVATATPVVIVIAATTTPVTPTIIPAIVTANIAPMVTTAIPVTPSLPDTGTAPGERNHLLDSVVAVLGLFTAAILLLVPKKSWNISSTK